MSFHVNFICKSDTTFIAREMESSTFMNHHVMLKEKKMVYDT